ncbi:MAG: heavy metal translocating P-type ATPase [Anaerolineae bacterium]|nr:heavy metal translocating P-type ATPase [Anaerolineae bacterium]
MTQGQLSPGQAPPLSQPVEIELPVLGMTCANCALTVERAVRRVHGVAEVTVNLATERAQIHYDPAQASVAQIVAAVRKAGYDVPTASAEEDSTSGDAEQAARAAEIADRRWRLILGLALGTPTFVLSMSRDLGLLAVLLGPNFAPMAGMAGHTMSEQAALNWVLFALALPVQVFTGYPYYLHGYRALRNGTANMDVLVALGSTAAFAWSVAVLLGMVSGHVYFETSAVILALISLGKYLEARARGHASQAVRRLMRLTPKTACVVREGREQELPIAQVGIGDVLIARPGEQIAADGVVIAGHASVDESPITGESLPKEKRPGDRVMAGTLNKDGVLRYEAVRVGRETLIAQIARLVAQAQSSRAPIQALADRVSGMFVPIVMGIAALTFIGWLVLGGSFERAMVNTVAVLVVACPCALGLATPMAMMVGMGRGAEQGVLFKHSSALEQLAHLRVAIFDKTGTLTHGQPAVTALVPLEGHSAEHVLQFAALAEQPSEHPLARAVLAAAHERGLVVSPPVSFRALPGQGALTVVNTSEGQRRVAVGNAALMREQGIPISEAAQQAALRLHVAGQTTAFVALEGRVIGLIGFADRPKPGAQEAIASLRRHGIRSVMLTGDNARAAQALAAQVGLDEVIAEVLPTDKAEHVRRIQAQVKAKDPRACVAMVGDGINDAPALAQADVGIAIGNGTDIALEAADVVLTRGDPRDLIRACALAQATLRGVRQNLFWAFFYNALLIPIAALGLFQSYGPVLAAGAMAFSSLFVVGNSLRLRRQRL